MDKEYYKNIEEIWKDIKGYEGLYQISNYGRVLSTGFRGRKLTIIQIREIIKLSDKKIPARIIAGRFDISRRHVDDIIKNLDEYLNKERILKLSKDSDGYLIVHLSKNNKKKLFKVHRLVLETFVGPCPPGMECRHLDGNPSNNFTGNLRWDTPKSNKNDTKIHGRLPVQEGEKNNNAKLNDWKVRIIIRLLEDGCLTIKEIAELFDVCRQSINDIRDNKKWKNISRKELYAA